MCMNMSQLSSSYRNPHSFFLWRGQLPKLRSFRLLCLIRRRKLRKEGNKKDRLMMTKLERKNMKLYLENENIKAENEKLRKRALLLHKENTVLLVELQNKFLRPFNPTKIQDHNKKNSLAT